MAPNGSAVSGQMTSLMCRQQSGVMTTNSQPMRSLLLVAAKSKGHEPPRCTQKRGTGQTNTPTSNTPHVFLNGVEMTDTPHWELFTCDGLCVTVHNLTAALKEKMKEEKKDLSSHFLSHPIEGCLEQQSPENGRINVLHLWTDTFFLSDLSKSQGKAGLPRRHSGKASTCQCRTCCFNSWVQEDALEKEMATCSSIILENPMERGAWWATVNGAAKSRAWLCTHTHTG